MDDLDKLRLQHCELMLNGMQLALLKVMQKTRGITAEDCMRFERCFVDSNHQIAITNEQVARNIQERDQNQRRQ